MPEALSKIVLSKTKHLLAQGVNQTETAQQLGISTKSVSRIKKRDKQEIEELAQQYVTESIKPIIENHKLHLNLSNELSSLLNSTSNQQQWNRLKQLSKKLKMIGLTAKDLLTIADKKEFRALQIMGIAPATTPGIVINNLYNQTNINSLDPEVAQLLAGKLSETTVYEAEFEEVEE